jgi:hypothetical protein
MIAPDDWRLTNQMNYLQNAVLVWKEYQAPSESWDHDHCEFCWAKFMEGDYPDVQRTGYATEDDYHWVCKPCFDDFKEMFGWTARGG